MAILPAIQVHTHGNGGTITAEVRAGETVLHTYEYEVGWNINWDEEHERAAKRAATAFGERLAEILAAGPAHNVWYSPNAPAA